MQIHADTTLIEAARRIAPVIREHNQEAERERRLSPPVLAALHEAGLLRMFTPRSLGGLETDPLTRALVQSLFSRWPLDTSHVRKKDLVEDGTH
jgi:alkylation response protein AidB-like acyl-CoA dehydrogenase